MGSSKKEKKKKKKKRTKGSDDEAGSRDPYSTEDFPTLEEYYAQENSSRERSKGKYDSESHKVDDSRNGRGSRDTYDSNYKDKKSRKSYNKTTVPETEEYVYDYSGQEIVQGTRDMSISPERTSYDKDNYKKTRDRSRSPINKKSSTVKELTPPPVPPGIDWPFNTSHTQPRPPGDEENEEWKQRDDRNRDRDYQAEVDRKYRNKQKEESKNRTATVESTNDGSSMSIEETNKLREKLGLKPLKVDGDDSASAEKSYEDREDVHQPAGNISQKKAEDKMREKMQSIREKRRINQKLRKTKGLAEEDDPVLDSAAAWVAKSRQQEKEKAMADKRAQMLEEMDEEFGISSIIEETVGRIKKEPSYTSKDLRGLKVQHKGNVFQEGSQVIMTLEDKGILAEDNEDILINVNIAADERTQENVKNRKLRPGYNAYDEVDDETGMLKVRGVLDKYDEEIHGTKKASFTIDGSGKADDAESELDRIRETLKAQQVSLSMAAPQLARDYYTEEEMVTFKKPRKKIRKVRKRTILKADDLLKLNQDDNHEDRGSRNRQRGARNLTNQDGKGEEDMEIVPTAPDELDYFVAVSQHEEPVSFVEDDEAEQELQLALGRSRRTKQKKGNESDEEDAALHKIAREVLSKPNPFEQEAEQLQPMKSKKKGKTTIILDSTSEFCRTLGDLPTAGSTSRKEKQETEEDAMEVEPEHPKLASGWEQVDYEKADESTNVKEDQEDEDVLEPEPLPTNLAATLSLANMKGYLKDGNEKIRRFDPLNLPETKAEVDVDKLRDEEKGRYTRGYDRDRDRYDPYAFKEKSNYKPEIKLEYVDSNGRELNRKEAFRLLSHKFHGKGSGKLKTEKRAKKILEDKKLKTMSSIDTPLNTSALFKEKQRQSQTPYLVLSGGGKNLLSGETLKK